MYVTVCVDHPYKDKNEERWGQTLRCDMRKSRSLPRAAIQDTQQLGVLGIRRESKMG